LPRPSRPLWAPAALVALASTLALAAGPGCQGARDQRVVVFYASSLSRMLGEAERALEAADPRLDVVLEPSGSQVAARKVAELQRPADLVISADWRVLEQILVPRHAPWVLGFTSNEIVLAYGEHSPGAGELDAARWPAVLLRDGVRLGRVDEDTAPLGFQTLVVWELAAVALGPPDLATRLRARCDPAHVVSDAEELVALLETRSVDFAFLQRNLVEEHRLQAVRLGPALDLSRPERAAEYARVRVPVRLRSGEPPVELAGAPAVYGLCVPRRAANPEGALRLVRFLLSPEGGRALARSGFTPLPPALLAGQGLPPGLAAEHPSPAAPVGEGAR
jgi:molybdate/tungstate transport system substrate-binding protein